MADATNNASSVEGAAAHDAAVSGFPLLGGGEARITLPTAVSDGDVVRSMHDDLGRQIIAPHSSRDRIVHNQITLSSTNEITLIAAGGAGVFRDLLFISGVTTSIGAASRIDFRDSTGGTVRLSMAIAGNGGGFVIPFPVPLTQGTVNNNWTVQLSSATLTVYVTAIAIESN